MNEKTLSQTPAIEQLKSLGYEYLTPEESRRMRRNGYDVLLLDVLRAQLNKLNRYEYGGVTHAFSADTIEQAIRDLDAPLTQGTVKANENTYNRLMLGEAYVELVGDKRRQSFQLKYIDWENLENNVFHVTEEFEIQGENSARPDIVLFVNGIPFGVIECKAPTVDIGEGIRQMIRNQGDKYIPQLFKYAQILAVMNLSTAKYAVTGTPLNYWEIWKAEDEEASSENQQPRTIRGIFEPKRMMELVRYFIVFDGAVKKICRYQQYYGVKATLERIELRRESGAREGGYIWHTQGSGKSLTMVMLAHELMDRLRGKSPRVILVTDREELDGQICATFKNTGFMPGRATSGQNLIDLIDSNKADIVTTIINKFNSAEKLNKAFVSDNIFVLVDECHRTNYGQFAAKMRTVFPNACYIGFSGTPLLKSERMTTEKRFGGLIHAYTIRDAVEDGAIVPLVYDGRLVEQTVDKISIDQWFERITKRLTPMQKDDLSRRWSSLNKLASSEPRIARIALDIDAHFEQNVRGRGMNAMLATNSKLDAIRYLNAFLSMHSDLRCAVVISAPDMREGADDVDDAPKEVIAFWQKMMNKFGKEEAYLTQTKEAFKRGEIDLLIVCSKLLTGFDAPRCQVIYIDKELKEHNLLQAIARTNRLFDGKDYGYIVDYRGLIKKLDEAMDMYSGAGLENFDSADLKGAMIDIASTLVQLRNAWSCLVMQFDDVPNFKKRHTKTNQDNVFSACLDMLETQDKRTEFYNNLRAFAKYYTVINSSEKALSLLADSEGKKYHDDCVMFAKLRKAAQIRYNETLDHREYEKEMQNLLDRHLHVTGEVLQVTEPVDILDKAGFRRELEKLYAPRAKADAIKNRLIAHISVHHDEDPAFYDAFSERIEAALRLYKDKRITESDYLETVETIMNDLTERRSHSTVPKALQANPNAQAYFGVVVPIIKEYSLETTLTEDILTQFVLDIDHVIVKNIEVDWTTKRTVCDRIKGEIDDLCYDLADEYGFASGEFPQSEFNDKIIESIMIVAVRRYHA